MRSQFQDQCKADDAKHSWDFIVEELGKEKARALHDALGGQRVWIPKHHATEKSLLNELDSETRAYLMRRFGNNHLDFPVFFEKPKPKRERIRSCLTVGDMSHNDIAQALSCSSRIIRREAKRMRDEGLLPPLPAKKLPSPQKEQSL